MPSQLPGAENYVIPTEVPAPTEQNTTVVQIPAQIISTHYDEIVEMKTGKGQKISLRKYMLEFPNSEGIPKYCEKSPLGVDILPILNNRDTDNIICHPGTKLKIRNNMEGFHFDQDKDSVVEYIVIEVKEQIVLSALLHTVSWKWHEELVSKVYPGEGILKDLGLTAEDVTYERFHFTRIAEEN